jgi:hypothetical protein
MKKRRLFALVAGALMIPTGTALAEPGTTGPPQNFTGDRVSDCTAGGFLGNTTNPREGGGIIPSQSPGPFVNQGENEPPRNDRVRGTSIGEAAQANQEANGNNAGGAAAACPGFDGGQG